MLEVRRFLLFSGLKLPQNFPLMPEDVCRQVLRQEASVNETNEQAVEDCLYQQYLEEMSGEAARRRSIEKASREQVEREAEIRRWAKQTGSPLPRDFEN